MHSGRKPQHGFKPQGPWVLIKGGGVPCSLPPSAQQEEVLSNGTWRGGRWAVGRTSGRLKVPPTKRVKVR